MRRLRPKKESQRKRLDGFCGLAYSAKRKGDHSEDLAPIDLLANCAQLARRACLWRSRRMCDACAAHADAATGCANSRGAANGHRDHPKRRAATGGDSRGRDARGGISAGKRVIANDRAKGHAGQCASAAIDQHHARRTASTDA